MDMNQNKSNYILDVGPNQILIDLLFDLAGGERIRDSISFEEQLAYYMEEILPGIAPLEIFIAYGKKYRMSSRYMFPGKPEQIKKRHLLIKTLASFVVLQELYECNNYKNACDFTELNHVILSKYALSSLDDQTTFEKEVAYLTRSYADSMNEETYSTFVSVMNRMKEDFSFTFETVSGFVMNDRKANMIGTFSTLLETYHISQSESVSFHLIVDAIAETVVIKNKFLEYENEFRIEWEKRFPNYKYGIELKEYIKAQKKPYIAAYGNNITSIRNENYLFTMLAEVTVKLALAEGAKNLHDLTKKIKELTSELGTNIREAFISSRKNVIRTYQLAVRETYSDDLREGLIPYRTDLLYLRDIIMEEISFRIAGNMVQRKSRNNKDSSEYELLLSQKDAEIYDLKRELEYYENLKQQEFKGEILQYNKALTDLFRKMCDFKYNSPLNELYLMAMGQKEVSSENVKGLLQNLIFILSSMNIVPYETGNVGKKVKFYDDEANIIYAVDENKVKEGLNQGIQVYPGWKYKDTELVLPKVEIKED